MRKKVTSKEQIVEVAVQIATRDGVDQVSIRKLASECGIAVGSMYNYYRDKDALIADVAEIFWRRLLEGQEQLYREGMGFTAFLEQYYGFLYGRLLPYDRSWAAQMKAGPVRDRTLEFLKRVLGEDRRINPEIWNMELNPDVFAEYVLVNLMALLQAGESNCRFFIFLLEHLLYDV